MMFEPSRDKNAIACHHQKINAQRKISSLKYSLITSGSLRMHAQVNLDGVVLRKKYRKEFYRSITLDLWITLALVKFLSASSNWSKNVRWWTKQIILSRATHIGITIYGIIIINHNRPYAKNNNCTFVIFNIPTSLLFVRR